MSHQVTTNLPEMPTVLGDPEISVPISRIQELEAVEKEAAILRESLRDQFAMAALQGLIRSDSKIVIKPCAEWCFEMADAMMEARKKN